MDRRRAALPVAAVQQVIEARRARRARVRAVAAPAAGVLAAGLASAVVVAIQLGGAPPAGLLEPAAPPPVVRAPTAPAPGSTALPPLDPAVLRSGYLPDLATQLDGAPELYTEAAVLADSWAVPEYPEAQAVVAVAWLRGVPLAVDDPAGGDRWVREFDRAGFTDRQADALASLWGTDVYTAKLLAALEITAG